MFVKSLLDPHGNYIKSEKNVKKYLKSISDEDIKALYDNIELTPFPILLAKEHYERFSKSNFKKNKNKSKNSRLKSSNSNNKKQKRMGKRTGHPLRHGEGIKFARLRGKVNGM